MGVTEEHPSGQKTAGFRGVAPGFLYGAMDGPTRTVRDGSSGRGSGGFTRRTV